MAGQEQPLVPLWAETKAKKQIDVLKEVAKAINESERARARQSVAEMTESDLEAEQFRLEAVLESGKMTVDGFRRLREIDFYLEGMRHRRRHRPAHEEWQPEHLSDE
jgi:hypothetical protein